MTPNRFRALIVAHVLLLAIAGWLAFVGGGYSPELEAAFEREPDPLLFQNAYFGIAAAASVVLAMVTGLVGLLMFRDWGRWLSVASTAVGFALIPIMGPTLSSPVESLVGEATGFLWAAILTLAYFSDLAHRFNTQRPRKDAI